MKSLTISLRLKENELNTIEEYARNEGVNRNKYIISSLLNKENTIPPSLLCRLRTIQKILCEYDGELTKDLKINLSREINELCAILLK